MSTALGTEEATSGMVVWGGGGGEGEVSNMQVCLEDKNNFMTLKIKLSISRTLIPGQPVLARTIYRQRVATGVPILNSLV